MREDRWNYATFYDAWVRHYRDDLAHYRALARRAASARGPVLELACGTGRVLPSLLADGARVVGLDRSPDQLRVARSRPLLAQAMAEGRLRLVQGDMRGFAFRTRFPLIVLAFNSICYLVDDRERRSFLSRVFDHLEEGGVFALDTDDSDRRTDDEEGVDYLDEVVRDLPGPGDVTRFFVAYERDPTDHRVELVRYRMVTEGPGGRRRREVWHSMRCLRADELREELREAGFRGIRIETGFDDGRPAAAAGSPQLVVTARRPAAPPENRK